MLYECVCGGGWGARGGGEGWCVDVCVCGWQVDEGEKMASAGARA